MTHVEFLVKWMNANVLKNQLEHFPQDLVTTGGRHIYEMIEFLSGKTVPQGAGGKAVQREDKKGSRHGNKSKEMQVINQRLAQYEGLLNFLKQHGGLLAAVRPEHFLSNEQFLRFQQIGNPTVSRRQVEKLFFPTSIDAWLTAILQTIKVFLLSRITPKAFR